MPTFEIYTTGGGFNLYNIFNFLAIFSSGSQFVDFISIGIMCGVIFLAARLAMTGNAQGTFNYFMIVAVVGGLSIGAKSKVVIMDTTYPLEIYGTVDNVPFSVAFVANLTTSTSYHLTRRMEALLAAPDNLSYQRHGIMFGATLMAKATRWRAVSQTVHTELVNFMEQCMVYGAGIDIVDINELKTSGDLISYINSEAPQSLGYYDPATSSTVSCDDGWAGLVSKLDNEVTKVLTKKASSLAVKDGVSPNIVDINKLTGTLDDFQSFMGMAGYDASRYIKQSMLVLALDDSVSQLIANSGNSAAMGLYQTARADSQTMSSYQAATNMAAKYVPYLKIFFEVLYYGAFPLALFLMMTPLAMPVLKGYFGGFLWLAAWEPLSAIAHSLVTHAATGFYREHTTTLSGASVTDVLNFANHLGISSVEQEVGGVAGFYMSLIPIISSVIFFGAGKMGGMAMSMLNVSQGASIDTGREAATGNLSMSNMSMHNMSANKHNTSSMFDTGRSSNVLKDGSIVTRNYDGSKVFSPGTSQTTGGLKLNVGQSLRGEYSERLADNHRETMSATSDLTTSLVNTSAQISDFAKTASLGTSAGTNVSKNYGTSQNQEFRDAWSTAQRVAQEHGLSTDVALTAMLAGQGSVGASAQLGLPKALKSLIPAGAEIKGDLGATLSAQGRLSADSIQRFNDVFEAAKSGQYSEALSTIIQTSEGLSASDTSSQGQNASNSIRSSLDNVRSSAVRVSEAYEEAKTLENAHSIVSGENVVIERAAIDVLKGYMLQEGKSDDQITSLIYPKTAAGFKMQRDYVDKNWGRLMDDLDSSFNFTGTVPQNNVPSSPSGQNYKPIDINKAKNTVVTPHVFDHEGAYSSHYEKVDSAVNEALDKRGNTTTFTDEIDQVRNDLKQEADQWVPNAMINRAGDMVGLRDHQLPNEIKTGIGGETTSAAVKNNPPKESAQSHQYGVDSNGFFHAPNVQYALDGATRDLAPPVATMATISGILNEMGPSFGFVATSGGQPSFGDDRVGGHRHDVGPGAEDHQGAVDGYLTHNGQRLYPGQHQRQYSEFIESAARHFPGIGHYDWGIHVGGGDQAVWGPDTTKNTVDQNYADAYWRGRETASLGNGG
jgi:conjugal transfer mating pair stabilization protein TraG